MKIKYLEKSYSTLTFNWKEENILQKKLSFLESLKKHEARTWLMEQKALYSQYCKKLWRSELTHARLLGDKDLVRQLTKDMFSSYHNTMIVGGESVLMAIEQSRRDIRKTPVPGYLCPNRDFSSASKSSVSSKEKESKKDPNWSLEPSKKKSNPDSKQSSLKRNLERRKLLAHQELGSLDNQVQFYFPRFHRSKEGEGQKRKSISANYRFHFNQRLPSPPNQQHSPTTHSGGDVPTDCQDTASGRKSKDKFLECLHYSRSRERGYIDKSRPSTRTFKHKTIQEELDQEEATPHMLLQDEIQARINQKPNYKEKVKHYLRELVIPPWHAPLPGGHYTKDLQKKDGQNPSNVWDSKVDAEQEWKRWFPVGTESNTRSVTLKKLDWCIAPKATSPEVLLLENYNSILTKENQVKRNWSHNNP